MIQFDAPASSVLLRSTLACAPQYFGLRSAVLWLALRDTLARARRYPGSRSGDMPGNSAQKYCLLLKIFSLVAKNLSQIREKAQNLNLGHEFSINFH